MDLRSRPGGGSQIVDLIGSLDAACIEEGSPISCFYPGLKARDGYRRLKLGKKGEARAANGRANRSGWSWGSKEEGQIQYLGTVNRFFMRWLSRKRGSTGCAQRRNLARLLYNMDRTGTDFVIYWYCTGTRPVLDRY